jgi:hypothetical protein
MPYVELCYKVPNARHLLPVTKYTQQQGESNEELTCSLISRML